jgi:L-rhamnose mutarotase
MKDAEIAFGKPNDIDLLDELEECKSTVFHYWENEFSLFFDEQKNQLFCCVEVDNKLAQLWGKQIFTLNEKQIIDLLKSKGYAEYESEVHEWGEKRISFEKANIDFYFEKNKLVSINYGQSIENTPILILQN